MKNEAVEYFDFSKDALFVDATLGGGGHSEEILKRMTPNSHLISFDIDDDAINFAKGRLKDYKNLKKYVIHIKAYINHMQFRRDVK